MGFALSEKESETLGELVVDVCQCLQKKKLILPSDVILYHKQTMKKKEYFTERVVPYTEDMLE